MTEFLLGLISGGAAGEGVRFLLGKAIERNDERVRKTKDLLIDDVERLRSMVEPIGVATLNYFGQPATQGKQISADIRKQLQTFAREWNQVNISVKDLGITSLKAAALIKFRSTLTLQLDVERDAALPIDSPLSIDIHKALEVVYGELSELRLRLA